MYPALSNRHGSIVSRLARAISAISREHFREKSRIVVLDQEANPFPVDLDLHLDLETRPRCASRFSRAFPLFAVKSTSISGNELALSRIRVGWIQIMHGIISKKKKKIEK